MDKKKLCKIGNKCCLIKYKLKNISYFGWNGYKKNCYLKFNVKLNLNIKMKWTSKDMSMSGKEKNAMIICVFQDSVFLWSANWLDNQSMILWVIVSVHSFLSEFILSNCSCFIEWGNSIDFFSVAKADVKVWDFNDFKHFLKISNLIL